MFDLAIIGAGPAGSTLARLLADRYRVLLLDSGRQKCCGGILAPFAQKMLAKLNLAVPKDVLVDPQPLSVAVWDLQTHLVRHYARQYINVDRSQFDRWLLSLVPPSADVRCNALYQKAEKNAHSDTLTIHFTENGEARSENVRWLIGADGAFSTVRREFFEKKTFPKQYTAIQEWYPLHEYWKTDKIDFERDYVGLFDAEITDYYAWAIPKNDQILLGAAVPFGKNPAERFALLKQKLTDNGLPLENKIRQEAAQIFRPLRLRSMLSGSDNIALIGEAAGLISPSSAEGIGSALCSAFYLASAFGQDGFRPSRYRRFLSTFRWNLWLKNVKIPAMFYPPVRKLIMLSGLTALS
jgi:flavin-dependent dehydrogenase